MKKRIIYYLSALVILVISAIAYITSVPALKGSVNQFDVEEKDKYDRPDLSIEFEAEKTQDPMLGVVPAEKRLQAFLDTKKNLANRRANRAAISGVKWMERGPNNVGGRTRALAFDPNDPTNKKVWAGAVGGGLWYNNDITMATSPWQNVDDFWANIAITSITFDPSDGDVMYVGTGEGWFNFDAIQGAGIWKSTDGGDTFTQLSSTDNSTFHHIQKVVVAANGDVFAATRAGSVQRSQDGGTSWSRVLNSGNVRAADIEIASNGDIYASLGIFSAASIYRSTDGGDNWTDVSPTITTSGRIEIAISPSESSTTAATVLFAVKYNGSATGSNDVSWLRKSSDGGSNWSDLTIPTDIQSGNHFTRGQAWYDLTLAVHPSSSDVFYVGGIDLHRNYFGTWQNLSQWFGGSGLPYVHADQHQIVFRPDNNGEAIFGNDGGVYYSSDIDIIGDPNFSAQNYGYNVTQFYAVSMKNEAGTNYFLAGAQDNGTHQFNFVGVNSTVEVTGGDGAFTFIDQDDSDIQIAAYTNNNYYLSTDGGESFGDLGTQSDDGRFINPADYDDDANILYAAGEAGEMIRYSGIGATVSQATVALSISSHQISAVTVSPNTSNRVFIGTGSGRVYRMDNANGTPSLTNISGDVDNESGYVSTIAIGDTDSELIATLSNYGVTSVFYSSDAGSSWTSKDEGAHGLPDMPIRWALFNPNNTDEVLLATEQGVWSTDDIAASNPGWEAVNEGLANVRCDMLEIRNADGLVIIGTHGRGLYSSDVFATATPQFAAEREEWYVGAALSFNDGSLLATSWAWDFDNDGITDATAQNPNHTYTSTGLKTVKLTINNDAGKSITKTNYINVIDRPTLPFTTGFESDGAGFYPYLVNSASEEIWEWGSGTSDKNNFNPGNSAATISGSNNWMTSLTSHHGFSTKYALETPPFSFLGGTGQYILEFDYRAASGTNAGMNMEYSIDGGDNWLLLDPANAGSTIANWYTTTNIIGLSGQDGWTGLSFSVVNVRYDVSDFIGEEDVRFRFVMGSISSANDGFQIDNFEISGAATSLPFTWDGSESTSWTDPDNWSSGSVPTSSDDVIIANVSTQPIVVDDQAVNDIEIEPGATVTVQSGASLAIFGVAFGDGDAIVERNTTASLGYSIIGSPITDATISGLGADIIYDYDGTDYTVPSGTMSPGKGYFAAFDDASPTASFTGIPNSGIITEGVSLGGDNFNIVANPYTASISRSAFISENGTGVIDGNIWLWDDGGANSGGDRVGDYIAVNNLGSTSTVDLGGGTQGEGAFNGSIGSMQGFLVLATANDDISFTADMQSTVAGDNDDANFYRKEEPQTIRLSISGNDRYSDILIGLVDGATLGKDYALDAQKFSIDGALSLYSIQDEYNYAIQAIPSIIEGSSTVTLGANVEASGRYSFELEEAFNMNGLIIFLEDKLTGERFNLSNQTSVSLFLENGNIEDRFLVTISSSILSIEELNDAFLSIFNSNGQSSIKYASSSEEEIYLYTLSGKLVWNEKVQFVNNEAVLDVRLEKDQIYLMKVNEHSLKFVLKN